MPSPRPTSLSVKVFWISFISITALLVLLGYISQNFIIDSFKKQQTRYVGHLLERTEVHLNLFMKNLQVNLLALSRDERLYSSLPENEAIPLLENYRMYWNQDLKNIYMITNDYKVFGTSAYLWEIKGHSMADKLYKGAVMSERIYWTEPYMSSVSDYTVSVAVPVKGEGDSIQGVLAVDLDLESIISSYGRWEYSIREDLLIVSRDGTPVTIYHPYVKYSVFDKKYTLSGLSGSQIADGSLNEWYQEDENGERLYISRMQNNNWGWQVMAVMKEQQLHSSIAVLRNYVLWIGCIGIALSCVLSYYLSRYVSRPIKLLIKQMRKVSTGDFQSHISLPFRGEIGSLVQTFNLMVVRIKRLMEDLLASERNKKQYELKVLQAQIQPHFLYNTLNSISYMARRNDTHRVDSMITSLVELLHFHLDKVDEYVPISQEAEGVKHYAYLLSIRYPDQFIVEVDIEDGVLECEIPKLTLQPLVENAIFHGILAKAQPGSIIIAGTEKDGDIVLEVSDDGAGMPQGLVGSLLAGQAQSSRPAYYHMGLLNIHHRLQLYYGEKYGLQVSSKVGEGTTVTLRLPAKACRTQQPTLQTGEKTNRTMKGE
ncbi:sensor histidine kinase [Cohnella sp.]|uniref:cache domain-containing sensor histidine kinase n=1 Tax=Cohnella sp. TaxID=1883426 RepID=UPI0035615AA3